MNPGPHFLEVCAARLHDSYLPRLRGCLEHLAPGDLLWRPNEHCNAVANLIVHMCGNLRQWIIHGLGGETDSRDRASEFVHRGRATPRELLCLAEQTVSEACATLSAFESSHLTMKHNIQGYEVTALEAAFHAVEHFGQHLGQIIYITKLRTDRDLGFYGHLNATGRSEGGRPIL